ncbi:MAG: hypothetical protein ACLQF2_14540 [Rhodomicrobium sp.]
MAYPEHWLALSTAIKSLKETGVLYANLQNARNEDSYGAAQYLCEQCAAVIRGLRSFRDDFANVLPAEVSARIDRFLSLRIATAALTPERFHAEAARGALVGLAALEAEVSFMLFGRDEIIRSRSERAFLHLQRSLAVDSDIQSKWRTAFENGETECEKLGSLHLLGFGIYAFKVNAEGARTDLVYPEPTDEALMSRAVEGFILTEWKVATSGNLLAKLREAKDQTERYEAGALAGIELRRYRYLVMVSLAEVGPMPADETPESGITYRHINIAIEPLTPSRAARRRASSPD